MDGVSWQVPDSTILGLVGESGSGKTTAALALLGYARPGVRIIGGSVTVAGHQMVGIADRELRKLRGRLISYVPQDPSLALNPARRIGKQIADVLRVHFPDYDRVPAVKEALERVHLPSDREFQLRFPHQLSGGQQQRLSIAMALAGDPPLVVLDEPTTGLDVVTQRQILSELRRLRSELGVSMLYVTHNLAAIGTIADQIAVMYAGRVAELGPAESILRQPEHPYTRGLIAAIPDHQKPTQVRGIPGIAVGVEARPSGCAFAPRCSERLARCELEIPLLQTVHTDHQVSCFARGNLRPLRLAPPPPTFDNQTEVLLSVEGLWAGHRTRSDLTIAARDVSFDLQRGECVAVVGESGSGKTTVARCIVGLHLPMQGTIRLSGAALAPAAAMRPRQARQAIQIVFQNPADSLNPRHRVDDAIARPARILRGLSRSEADLEVQRLLERVRLSSRLATRYPRELSGGERQRVAIARALAAEPELIICDEVTSALDVSVQAAVLELLAELRADLNLSLLFISHDLGVVASISDRVVVLERGEIREEGATHELLEHPRDDYTRLLIDAVPRLPELDLSR